MTRPPKRLTEATLVDAMEDIQKYMTDRDLKKIMKEAKGIGMPSSRAQIIKDLITTGYMEVKGKGLYITQSGKDYIEYIGDHSIVNPNYPRSGKPTSKMSAREQKPMNLSGSRS